MNFCALRRIWPKIDFFGKTSFFEKSPSKIANWPHFWKTGKSGKTGKTGKNFDKNFLNVNVDLSSIAKKWI